jgi:transcriptional regulator with XRE-family HTH domain
MMMIGERIRQIREQQGLSQKHIEERTGLLRCYVSRVENGHTVPSLETLERFAWALGVPLHLLFCAQDDLPSVPHPGSREALLELAAKEPEPSEAQFLLKLRDLLSRMVEPDREVILAFAKKLAAPTDRQH